MLYSYPNQQRYDNQRNADMVIGPPNPFLDPQALLKNKMGVLNEMFQGTEYFMHNKKPMGFLFHWNILLSANL